MDKHDIRKHVDALLKDHPSTGVHKWQGTVPFMVIGAITPEELGYLESKTAYLNELIGDSVQFQRTDDLNSAKLFFIFADEMGDLADKKLIISLLRSTGQSQADFRRSLRDPDTYMRGRFGSTDGRLGAAAVIAEMKGLSADQRQSRIFQAAFNLVIGTVARSDHRPSIVDKPPGRTIVTDRLPSLDEAFVAALYSPRVTFAMERQEAALLIVDMLHGKLESK